MIVPPHDFDRASRHCLRCGLSESDFANIDPPSGCYSISFYLGRVLPSSGHTHNVPAQSFAHAAARLFEEYPEALMPITIRAGDDSGEGHREMPNG